MCSQCGAEEIDPDVDLPPNVKLAARARGGGGYVVAFKDYGIKVTFSRKDYGDMLEVAKTADVTWAGEVEALINKLQAAKAADLKVLCEAYEVSKQGNKFQLVQRIVHPDMPPLPKPPPAFCEAVHKIPKGGLTSHTCSPALWWPKHASCAVL